MLPFSFVTKTGPVLLEGKEQLYNNFKHYLEAMDLMELDLVQRHPISLKDCSCGTCLCRFGTRLVTRGRLAKAPYTSTAFFRDAQQFKMSPNAKRSRSQRMDKDREPITSRTHKVLRAGTSTARIIS